MSRVWTKEDTDLLNELWYDCEVSKEVMVKRLNRSYNSIKTKALRLNLGGRLGNYQYLTIQEISNEMQVSYDKVRFWISRMSLKKHKNKSGKAWYLIDTDDLLEFLKEHPSQYDASKISEYLFTNEPDWLVNKRREDLSNRVNNKWYEYSNEDDKLIVSLFKLGKSDEEIAEKLGRTKTSIRDRRLILCLYRDEYNPWELDILYKYSDYKTVDELKAMLPLRSSRSIMYWCEKLKLPYHLSKKRCKSLNT